MQEERSQSIVSWSLSLSMLQVVAIVIAKSNNPRCFKHIDKSKLTGEILDKILCKLNSKLKSTSRYVLLIMDSAGCHPKDLHYSNTKIVFLSTNATSKRQPLDLGIIESFKVHYKKLFLRYVLARLDEFSLASEFG